MITTESVTVDDHVAVPQGQRPITDLFYLENSTLRLYGYAIGYLATPALLFLAAAADPAIGWPLAVMLGGGVTAVLWRGRFGQSAHGAAMAVSAVLAALTLLVAGFPHGPFAWDWIKHWGLINHLATHEWPSTLAQPNGSLGTMRYYVAAYLVPAAAAKGAPGVPLWLTTALWFGLGTAVALQLAVVPMRHMGRRSTALAAVLLLCFAGADLLAENAVRLVQQRTIADIFGLHYEGWFAEETGMQLQYTSMLGLLLWVPHQAIATMLVASMLAIDRSPGALPRSLLAFGLLALWSPYGMIGLLPLVAVRVLQSATELQEPAAALQAATGLAFAAAVAAYLSTDTPQNGMCISCAPARFASAGHFAIFLTVELGAILLILRRRLHDTAVVVSTLTLAVIPFFYGEAPDFVMRASMGPLFILAMRCTETLVHWRRASTLDRWLYAVALSLMLPTAISEVTFHLSGGSAHRRLDDHDPLKRPWYTTFAGTHDVTAKRFFEICGWRFYPQYFTAKRPRIVRSEGP
jgi:hypothetical protein